MKIWLDAGHGGKYSGAVGDIGVFEKDINLSVVMQMAGYLSDHEVGFSRIGDVHLSQSLNDDLILRTHLAEEWGADVLCSIHCNAYNDPGVRGFEVFTDTEFDTADELAAMMFFRFREQFPNMKGRTDGVDLDLPGKQRDYVVLHNFEGPAVLFELGFITHVGDQKRLLDPAWQTLAASCLSKTIIDWEVRNGSG